MKKLKQWADQIVDAVKKVLSPSPTLVPVPIGKGRR
jgi:hypothetical protein